MIQRRPWVSGTLALLTLLALALPLFSMRLAFTDAGNDPTSLTTRQAYDLLAEGFGPGFNGPLVLAAPLSASADAASMEKVDATLRATPGIAFAAPVEINADHSAAVIIAYPTTSPQAAQTSQLVTRLRTTIIPEAVAGTGLKVLVGGGDRCERGRLQLPRPPSLLGNRRRDRARLLVAHGGFPVPSSSR
jgi:RND superfamily putative drug exporter